MKIIQNSPLHVTDIHVLKVTVFLTATNKIISRNAAYSLPVYIAFVE